MFGGLFVVEQQFEVVVGFDVEIVVVDVVVVCVCEVIVLGQVGQVELGGEGDYFYCVLIFVDVVVVGVVDWVVEVDVVGIWLQ